MRARCGSWTRSAARDEDIRKYASAPAVRLLAGMPLPDFRK
jgi:hypothetical protein